MGYNCDCKKHLKNVYKTIKKECYLSSLTSIVRKYPAIKQRLESPLETTTLFAPDNTAICKFCGKIDQKLLTYHALDGVLDLGNIQNGLYPTLLKPSPPPVPPVPPEQNVPVRVTKYTEPTFKNMITVNQAVIMNNIKATNGEVNVIDRVLTPPSSNIVEVAVNTPELSILVTLVKLVPGLVKALSETENLTVFAPTDKAFKNLAKELSMSLADLVDRLITNPDVLHSVLDYHVLGLFVVSAPIKKGLTKGIDTSSVTDTPLVYNKIDLCKGKCLYVIDQLSRKAKVVKKDVLATNGVIHIINKVLLPGNPPF